MPPSYRAANERHRLLTERMDADVPELVLMLLESIRGSQDAEGEADESSHPLRALFPHNPQGFHTGNPQDGSWTMGDVDVPRDATNVRGTGQHRKEALT